LPGPASAPKERMDVSPRAIKTAKTALPDRKTPDLSAFGPENIRFPFNLIQEIFKFGASKGATRFCSSSRQVVVASPEKQAIRADSCPRTPAIFDSPKI
jgi:hypothetical protein